MQNDSIIGPPGPASVDPRAEFADAKGVRARFGICRSHAYSLAAEGSITSVVLRRRGAVRGKRLFDLDSIRAFLKANIDPPKEKKPSNHKRRRKPKKPLE